MPGSPTACRLFGSALAGCLLVPAGCTETDVLIDPGNVRIRPLDEDFERETYDFASGIGLAAHVKAGIFVSDCDDVDASCSVTRDGESIVVEAQFVRKRHKGRLGARKCGDEQLTAECELLEGLTEGSYVVEYGSASAPLEIPSTGPALVVGPLLPP